MNVQVVPLRGLVDDPHQPVQKAVGCFAPLRARAAQAQLALACLPPPAPPSWVSTRRWSWACIRAPRSSVEPSSGGRTHLPRVLDIDIGRGPAQPFGAEGERPPLEPNIADAVAGDECSRRAPRRGYRQHSCRNTLQGLSSSPRVPPSRPPGAGDRRRGETGAVLSGRNARHDRTVQQHGTRRIPCSASVRYNTRGRISWTGREDRRLSAGFDPAAGRAQPAPRHPRVRASARLPHRRLHRGDRLRTGVRETPATRRADERPAARRPPGRERTLPARPVGWVRS